MLNKEKYAKEILDIVCQGGEKPAVIDNIPIKCTDVLDCRNCKFYSDNDCSDAFVKWANSEYKEHKIDWNKVPVDTPIYVWDDNEDNIIKIKRHFAEYDTNNNRIIAFMDGQTSWSSEQNVMSWDNAEIKEGIDCSQWYKDEK